MECLYPYVNARGQGRMEKRSIRSGTEGKGIEQRTAWQEHKGPVGESR